MEVFHAYGHGGSRMILKEIPDCEIKLETGSVVDVPAVQCMCFSNKSQTEDLLLYVH